MNTVSRTLVFSAAVSLFAGCMSKTDNFSIADEDGDGKLSKTEVKKALVTAIYSAGDPDGDGRISYPEYKSMVPDFPQSRFRAYDRDGDGFVTPREVDQYGGETTRFDVLISSMDLDGDGFVDREEAEAFNDRLMAAEGDNALQKLSKLVDSLGK